MESNHIAHAMPRVVNHMSIFAGAIDFEPRAWTSAPYLCHQAQPLAKVWHIKLWAHSFHVLVATNTWYLLSASAATSSFNMSARGPSMPELPGMWYDPVKNRYFALSQEHRPPPPPRPNNIKRLRLTPPPLLGRMLRERELGTLSKSKISASLIVNGVRRAVSAPSVPADENGLDLGCTAFLKGNDIILRNFSSGTVVKMLRSPRALACIDWNQQHKTAAVASYDRMEYLVTLISCDPVRTWGGFCRRAPTTVYSIALSPDCKSVVLGTRNIAVWKIRSEDLIFDKKLDCGTRSNALSSLYPEEHCIVAGFRSGVLSRWDLRTGSKACSRIRPRARYSSIICLKASSDNRRVYASSLLNPEGNLCAWDWRFAGRDPLLVFAGHQNAHKPLKFDVVEGSSGGLLASGGDDGIVRIWDCNNGGQPLSQLDLGSELPQSIEFACWESHTQQRAARAGMWLTTDETVYTLEIGGGR